MPPSSLSAQPTTAATETLPYFALLALAMTGFICIMTETLPAGLLPQISRDLHITPSLAGQMVSAYAIGSLLAAIPLTVLTRKWRRRTVLLTTIIGFLLFNSLTAWSPNFVLTLVARCFAGVAAGLAWSLLAGYARRMVAPHLQGRAMAIAMVGTPIALSLGMPLGTWLGTAVGWRMGFGIMSLLSVVLIAWVVAKVPDYPGDADMQDLPLRQVFTTPGVRPVLGVVVMWMSAHNILYTYIAPISARAGLSDHVDRVLLLFGIAALLGIWITGRVVDHFLRWTVMTSLAGFALVAVALGLDGTATAVVYGAVGLWGLTFGGAATLLQTALADAANDGADIALSMNVVTWNSAIAGGALMGGVLLQHVGIMSFAWVALMLLLVGLVIVWAAREHGFAVGRRASSKSVVAH